jgi:L,D-transpeptidase-like protein/putative peptidoglycan binding protein
MRPLADLMPRARRARLLLGGLAISIVPTLLPLAATPAHAVGVSTPAVTVQAAAAPRQLRLGMHGADVKALQMRLVALHYDHNRSYSGTFDDDTLHALVAFQKHHGLARDGVLGPKTRAKLAHPSTPRPRSPRSGTYVEINIAKQVLYVFRGSQIVKIVGVSSGSGRLYTVDGHTSRAVTPRGRFKVQRGIDAWRKSRLGMLYRPKYFTGGYAVHGSYSVPSYPVSHGCVRVTLKAMDRLWKLLPVGRPVYVYSR